MKKGFKPLTIKYSKAPNSIPTGLQLIKSVGKLTQKRGRKALQITLSYILLIQ